MPALEPAVDRATLDRYLEAAAKAVAGIDGRECVYIAGSLIEGHGNAESDLDVFVVTGATAGSGEGATYTFGDATVLVDYVDDSVRCDTELWSRRAIADCAERIAACGADDLRAVTALDDRDLQFAHRLRTAVPVENEAVLAELQALFDWTHLSRVLRNWFIVDYNGWAEDAIGAVNAGDAGTAMLTSRLALGAAVDALLAAHGQTNNKPKWRFRKLERHGDRQLLDDYLRLEVDASPAPEDLLAQARQRLRKAALLAGKAAAAR